MAFALPNKGMAVIGVTGGIGSGKSTFCRMLGALLPAEVFDADRVAGEVLADNLEVREAVVSEVSPQAYGADGLLDRELLRSLIFDNAGAKKRLEAIVHPHVRSAWRERAEGVRRLGGHFLVDIPLLYETGAEEFFDMVVVVGCSEETQLARVEARGVDAGQAAVIARTQMPTLEKAARADFVVWNDGSLEFLEEQARELVARLKEGEKIPRRVS
jgi:dephospho-CoA kinase